MYFHIISELSFFGKLKVDKFNGMFERSDTKYNRFELYSHFDCSYYSELKYAFIKFQEYFHIRCISEDNTNIIRDFL